MGKPSCFTYPENLQILDLATLVSMYRSRGEPQKAPAGTYYGCAYSHKLLKEGKSWFGLHYSQTAWDALLTKGSEGYPLTQVELNILGMAYFPRRENEVPVRSLIERHSGTLPQLAFMIVNDLKTFGFLEETEDDILQVTSRGFVALEGIANRIYGKKFSADMLPRLATPAAQNHPDDVTTKSQTSLF